MDDETPHDNRERIATLEEQRRMIQQQIGEIRQVLAETQRDVREIKRTVTSHKGFVAGIVVTVSVVWSVALGVWQFIKHKFGA